jgi:hypothetical protein
MNDPLRLSSEIIKEQNRRKKDGLMPSAVVFCCDELEAIQDKDIKVLDKLDYEHSNYEELDTNQYMDLAWDHYENCDKCDNGMFKSGQVFVSYKKIWSLIL